MHFTASFNSGALPSRPINQELWGQGPPSRRPARILFPVPNRSEEPSAPPSNDGHPAAERLRELLSRRIATLERSHRSLERELGWGHGILGNLLRGRTVITLRHVEELAPILGTTPLELLSEAYVGIPSESGQGFRREGGHHSDVKAATDSETKAATDSDVKAATF